MPLVKNAHHLKLISVLFVTVIKGLWKMEHARIAQVKGIFLMIKLVLNATNLAKHVHPLEMNIVSYAMLIKTTIN